MSNKTLIIFSLLITYVILQFLWWGYHISSLTEQFKSVSKDFEIASVSIKEITEIISQNKDISKKEIYSYCLKLKK